jgi:hypothetical protein
LKQQGELYPRVREDDAGAGLGRPSTNVLPVWDARHSVDCLGTETEKIRVLSHTPPRWPSSLIDRIIPNGNRASEKPRGHLRSFTSLKQQKLKLDNLAWRVTAQCLYWRHLRLFADGEIHGLKEGPPRADRGSFHSMSG